MSRIKDNKYVRNPSIRHLSLLRSGTTILWLTSSTMMSKSDHEMITRLQNSYGFIFLYYTKTSKALKYINGAKSCEYFIIVINDHNLRSDRTIFSRLQENHQVRAIVVVTNEKEEMDSTTLQREPADKIVICQEQESLAPILEHLLKDATQQIENNGDFITYNPNEKALRDVRHELGAFAWGYCNVCMLNEIICLSSYSSFF